MNRKTQLQKKSRLWILPLVFALAGFLLGGFAAEKSELTAPGSKNAPSALAAESLSLVSARAIPL